MTTQKLAEANLAAVMLKNQLNAAKEEIERLRKAVAFARSVIKSGEPWSETCEIMLSLEEK